MSNPALQQVALREGEVKVTFLNLGAITLDWTIGNVSMVRRLARIEDYLTDKTHTGVLAGRVANRTANGQFELDGQRHQLTRNEGQHHLHGGALGLGKRLWHMEPDGPQNLRLSYHSPDGEEGYPAAVDFTVDISLSNQILTYDMRATPSAPTPINIAQHSYYTLGCTAPIRGATLALNADHFTVADAEGIPTGTTEPVAGSKLDFRQPRLLAPQHAALDHNLLFSNNRNPADPIATLHANGYRLRMWSDQPGAQVYTGAHLPQPNAAICIEPQAPPNALNQPSFPSIIATPEQPYRQVLRVEICEASL